MTLPQPEQRTAAYEDSRDRPASSDFVASTAESTLDDTHATRPSPPPTDDLESGDLPVEFHRALRAARTPLIEGVDFRTQDAQRNAALPESPTGASWLTEKSRVDTLSPLEAVPPQAPFPSEPPPARPSVVPPVRLPHNGPVSAPTRSDPPPRGIRSDPPPRIPISDRPSRPAYRSEPPPHLAQSDPPPRSSGRGPSSYRRSWADAPQGWLDPMAVPSLEAQRREAVTIPADARSPTRGQDYDTSMPLPALRAPSFPIDQLPLSIRQHENSRLRNVAMTMMFVIFIIIGAVAGMRWYVGRDENLSPSPRDTAEERPRVPRTRLDRPEPNAVVAPRAPEPASDVGPDPSAKAQPSTSRGPASPPVAGPGSSNAPGVASAASSDPTLVRSPWESSSDASRAQAGKSRQKSKAAPSKSSRKDDSKALDPRHIDTKSPLIAD